MQLHTISLHWKFALGEKFLATQWTWTRIGIASGFLVRHSTHWAISVLSPVSHMSYMLVFDIDTFWENGWGLYSLHLMSKLMAVPVAPLLFIGAIIFLSFILQCTQGESKIYKWDCVYEWLSALDSLSAVSRIDCLPFIYFEDYWCAVIYIMFIVFKNMGLVLFSRLFEKW